MWRWRYDLGESSVSSQKETVVVNIDKDGNGGAPQGHTTRTLEFDKQGRLYISVGSGGLIQILIDQGFVGWIFQVGYSHSIFKTQRYLPTG